MMKFFLLSFFFLYTLNAAQEMVSIDHIYSKEYHKCISKAVSGLDALNCTEKEIRVQDKILNESYKEAMKRIQKFRRVDLRNMQRLWIKYTDAKCDFYYHKESGSGGRNDASNCKLEEITKRGIELDEIY